MPQDTHATDTTPATSPLILLGQRQATWSATANVLKARHENARWTTLGFSIAGALLAAIASQLNGQGRIYFAIASSIMFVVVTFVSARRLGQQQAGAWVRARAASEALKREAYTYAASAAPYDSAASRDAHLRAERARIEQDVDDLLAAAVPGGPIRIPTGAISNAEYLNMRVEQQINDFFEPQARASQVIAARLRTAECYLAFATACITAIAGVTGKYATGLSFDFVALTAVLTTVSGAVLAHIEASRYDHRIATSRATARRLRDALDQAPGTSDAAEWSAFIRRCEEILAAENNAWIAKWSKPS